MSFTYFNVKKCKTQNISTTHNLNTNAMFINNWANQRQPKKRNVSFFSKFWKTFTEQKTELAIPFSVKNTPYLDFEVNETNHCKWYMSHFLGCSNSFDDWFLDILFKLRLVIDTKIKHWIIIFFDIFHQLNNIEFSFFVLWCNSFLNFDLSSFYRTWRNL